MREKNPDLYRARTERLTAYTMLVALFLAVFWDVFVFAARTVRGAERKAPEIGRFYPW